MNTIEVVIENTHERRYVKQGISLLELVQEYYTELGRWPLQSPVLGALVNNVVTNLHYRLYNPKTIRFFDINCSQGWRMYFYSLRALNREDTQQGWQNDLPERKKFGRVE